MASEFRVIPFAELLSEPVRNGIYESPEKRVKIESLPQQGGLNY